MASFKVDGHTKVKTFKQMFKETFNATLRVYKGNRHADDEATLASIREEGHTGGEFECGSQDLVNVFEDFVYELYGIKVQVATQDDWVLVLDGITLENAGKIKKGATKADMQQYVGVK